MAKLLTPAILHRAFSVERVDVDGDGLERLRKLDAQRVILTPKPS